MRACAPGAIVLEPVARNTAPAAAVAALMVAREDPAGILVVMPSDHVIKDEPGFLAAVRRAAEIARTGKLVLFGIRPDSPHTGYGYIRRGAPLPGVADAYAVDAFTEKPDPATAAAYLAGRHLFLEQRHLRASRRARSWTNWPAFDPRSWRQPSRRSPTRARTWASCASGRKPSRGPPPPRSTMR